MISAKETTKIDLSNYPDITAGENVEIQAEDLEIVGKVTIGTNVKLWAQKIYLGDNSRIDDGVVVRALEGDTKSFYLGDESFIGQNTKIMVPDFKMGDYSNIYNHNLISGYKGISIGHNCWIGQHTILNSYETLTIGNNCRIGPHVQMWTHVASGELLEGCNFFGSAPITLEDNVWFQGGGATVIPGLTLKRNTILMVGAVLTKSTEPYKIYAGVPAVDVTEKMKPWKPMTLDDKMAMLKDFLKEFVAEKPEYEQSVFYAENEQEAAAQEALQQPDTLLFIKEVADWAPLKDARCTVFDLNTKSYTKKRSPIEIAWLVFTVGYRARFVPRD